MPGDARDGSRRYLILAICCTSLFIVGLDNTIVNVALPSIKRDLHASVAELQWVVDAYSLVIATLLILAGSTADRVGRARIFKLGLILFLAGSLLCGVAPSIGLLIAFRALQAIGGSMLNPVALSIVRNTFTDPRERAFAIGVWSAVFGLSLALGPVLGGVLVDGVSWRAIFWVNVPVVLVAGALTHRFVPESRAPHARRFDPVGQVLTMVMLGTLVFGIIRAPSAGWTSPSTLATFAVTVAALCALVPYEARRREPLIDPRFFRSAPFSGATLIAVLTFSALGGFLFLNTLYLQDGRGYSALHAGLLTLPLAAGTAIVGPLSGRLVGLFGARPSMISGGLAMLTGALLLTGLRTDTETGLLIASYLLFGVGVGFVNPPITNTAVSGMPSAQAGVASAVASSSRQVGQSLGVALIGAIAVANVAHPSGLAAASHTGMWLIVGCEVLVVVLGVVTTGRWAQRTARGAAAALRDGEIAAAAA